VTSVHTHCKTCPRPPATDLAGILGQCNIDLKEPQAFWKLRNDGGRRQATACSPAPSTWTPNACRHCLAVLWVPTCPRSLDSCPVLRRAPFPTLERGSSAVLLPLAFLSCFLVRAPALRSPPTPAASPLPLLLAPLLLSLRVLSGAGLAARPVAVAPTHAGFVSRPRCGMDKLGRANVLPCSFMHGRAQSKECSPTMHCLDAMDGSIFGYLSYNGPHRLRTCAAGECESDLSCVRQLPIYHHSESSFSKLCLMQITRRATYADRVVNDSTEGRTATLLG